MKAVALPPGPVVVAFDGPALTGADVARLQHPLVGGVILFARNFESRAQLLRLTEQIRSLRTPRLLVTVDHEGGRVQRFREGFTRIVPMRTLGERFARDPLGACRQAVTIGKTIGDELRAVGVDLSFTPVLDLDLGRSEVIGDRSFSADPRVVTLLAQSLNHGLLLAGMANCGKHFPGHGWARADSHLALPIDTRARSTLLERDAAPYGWLGPTLMSVMPAHVVYPKVDDRPAGFSPVWLREILREQLGFTGLVFSDDLTMAGAAFAGGLVERARAALAAGCDMVLVCRGPEADEVLAGLRWRRPRAFDARLKALMRWP